MRSRYLVLAALSVCALMLAAASPAQANTRIKHFNTYMHMATTMARNPRSKTIVFTGCGCEHEQSNKAGKLVFTSDGEGQGARLHLVKGEKLVFAYYQATDTNGHRVYKRWNGKGVLHFNNSFCILEGECKYEIIRNIYVFARMPHPPYLEAELEVEVK